MISVIIPVQHRSSGLEHFLRTLEQFADAYSEVIHEFILVSHLQLIKTDPNFSDKIKILQNLKNMKTGQLVREGLAQASGQIIGFMNESLHVPLKELLRVPVQFQQKCEYLVGVNSQFHTSPLLERTTQIILKNKYQGLLGDFQFFSADKKSYFLNSQYNSEAIAVEFMTIAESRQLNIVKIEVALEKTEVPPQAGQEMTQDLLAIAFKKFLGKYKN